MTPTDERHGFLLLHTEAEYAPPGQGLFQSLVNAGFGPYDGNGYPAVVLITTNASKPLWFEAGFMAGRGVPLLLVGMGRTLRQKHREAVSRLGGWSQCEQALVLPTLARMDISPSDWDARRIRELRQVWAERALAEYGYREEAE
jgi:hypothetical protein